MNDKKSLTRFLPHVARVLMGLPLLVFGLNGLFHFLPEPKAAMPEGAMAFLEALVKSGFMLPLIATTQAVAGACLLANRFVPLALALLAPFLVNALAFHLALERSGLPIVAVFLLLELYLAWTCRQAFRPMLAMKVPLD
ncbi:MAG TPA: hypothetical protein VJ600_05395 [Holophagaceae bacterium]|nr:hypothetical protein [Holophagaceae bacterium]